MLKLPSAKTGTASEQVGHNVIGRCSFADAKVDLQLEASGHTES